MKQKTHRIAIREFEDKIQWRDISFSNYVPEGYRIIEFDSLDKKTEFIKNVKNKKCIIKDNNVIFEELKEHERQKHENKLIDRKIKGIERLMYSQYMMNKVIDFIVSNDNFAKDNKDLVDDFKLKEAKITKLKTKLIK